MNSLSWKCLAVLALALVVSGCGDGGPRLYKAGGTVMYKGAPVEGATVTFGYDDGNFANGYTDAAGKFKLLYMGKPGGAALGKCKVGISKVVGVKINAPAAANSNKAPKSKEEYDAMNAAKVEGMKKFAEAKAAQDAAGGAASLIPKHYADGTTSGLSYEITTNEATNDWTIELKDK